MTNVISLAKRRAWVALKKMVKSKAVLYPPWDVRSGPEVFTGWLVSGKDNRFTGENLIGPIDMRIDRSKPTAWSVPRLWTE